MDLKTRLARLENRARTIGDRVSQIERNTSRIEDLEDAVAELQAVVKVKGKTIG